MRQILINGRFLTRRITGVERYAREILFELDKIIKYHEIEIAIPPEVDDIPNYKNIKITRVGKLKNRLWEHISLPFYAIRKQKVILSLCNVAPLVSPGIVCIHDVKIKAKPQYFEKKFLLWYEILFTNETKRAKKILTVSEFSKKEIIKYFHVKESDVIVIPNAWQHYERVKYDENTLRKYQLKKDEFYFSMGSMEPNKNFSWIAQEAKKNPNEVFAISGKINNEVFANGMGFVQPDNMKILGYVSDEEAKTLMRDCKAFLFPTFYEGFGIPPLEAVSAGCKKIVVSDTEVMHEVFEDCAEYVNPYTSEWKDNAQYESKRVEMEKIMSKYSWKKSANLLYDVLKSIH